MMNDPDIKTDNEIRDESPVLHCSICGDVILPDLHSGWSGGHNAEPINSGRCCGNCNTTVVVPERIRRIYAKRTAVLPNPNDPPKS